MPAATTALFYEDCPFEAITADSPEAAARLIESGETVLVPTSDIAAKALILLGLSADEARAQLLRTNPRLSA